MEKKPQLCLRSFSACSSRSAGRVGAATKAPCTSARARDPAAPAQRRPALPGRRAARPRTSCAAPRLPLRQGPRAGEAVRRRKRRAQRRGAPPRALGRPPPRPRRCHRQGACCPQGSGGARMREAKERLRQLGAGRVPSTRPRWRRHRQHRSKASSTPYSTVPPKVATAPAREAVDRVTPWWLSTRL